MTTERRETRSLFQRIGDWIDERRLHSDLASNRKRFERRYAKDARAVAGSLGDFEKFKSLGKGGCGQVELVRNKRTRKISALKVIEKATVTDENDMECLLRERRIMRALNHPFLGRLKSHFICPSVLCLEMPYYPGGDLTSFVIKRFRCTVDVARFYAAQLVLAVDFLHSVGVIHRDLKPDNIVVGADGYLKVIDFGLAVRATDDRIETFCGTPDYLAPEVYLAADGQLDHYGRSVDWWSFGLIVFELITGREAFNMGIHERQNIIEGKVAFPSYLDFETHKFLAGCLEPKVRLRLGCGRNGVNEIIAHPWFRDTDWPAVYFKKVKAPYIPEVPDFSDISCIGFRDFQQYDGSLDFTFF